MEPIAADRGADTRAQRSPPVPDCNLLQTCSRCCRYRGIVGGHAVTGRFDRRSSASTAKCATSLGAVQQIAARPTMVAFRKKRCQSWRTGLRCGVALHRFAAIRCKPAHGDAPVAAPSVDAQRPAGQFTEPHPAPPSARLLKTLLQIAAKPTTVRFCENPPPVASTGVRRSEPLPPLCSNLL